MNRADFIKLLNNGTLPAQMKMMISLAMNAVTEKQFQAGLADAQRLLTVLRSGDDEAIKNQFEAAGIPPELVTTLLSPAPNGK